MPEKFVVRESFDAEESDELSVHVGEVVVKVEDDNITEDWMKVFCIDNPKKFGVVPQQVLQHYDTPRVQLVALPDIGSSPSSAKGRGSPPAKEPPAQAPPSQARVPDKAKPDAQPDTFKLTQNLLSSAQTAGSQAAPSSNAFQDLFYKHEEYFRNMTAKRERCFRKLEDTLATTSGEIRSCKEQNERLKQQAADLERLVTAEREKWLAQLEGITKH